MSDFPISWVRECFPALNLGDNFIFFDNGAGAQIPQAALDAVQKHLILRNVQRGGRYRQSVEVDETIQRARQSVAAFLNANSADEVAFGMNATSFIRIVSLAITDIMGARREIIVTDMDHEANIATWLVLEKRGAEIRWWKMREDGLLHTEDLEPLLSSHTRMVACAMASNALGSIVDVKEVSRMAHAAGMDAAIGYIEDLGRRTTQNGHAESCRAALVGGMLAIRYYEAKLSARLLEELQQQLPRVSIYGVRDPEHIARRVPTICFNIGGVKPATVT